MKTILDTGMACLMMMLRHLHIPFSVENLKSRLGKDEVLNSDDLIFLVRDHLRLTTVRKKCLVKQFASLPFPFIAEMSENKFCMVLKYENGNIFAQVPGEKGASIFKEEEFIEQYLGFVILISDKESDSLMEHFADFRLFWFAKALFTSKFIFSQVIISSLILQIFILITPLFTMVIVDKVLSSSGRSTLEVLMIGLAIITIFDFLIQYCRRYLLHHLSNKVDLSLVSHLFQHLTYLPMSFFHEKQTADTISRMKEVESIRSFFTGNALSALIDFPFSFIFLIVMYFFSPLLCFIVFGSILISIFIYAFLSPILKQRVKQTQEDSTDTQSFLFEMVYGIETIKSLSAEAKMQRAWENELAKHSNNSSRSEQLSSIINQIASFLNKATIVLCLYIGALLVLDGNMTAGQLIAFNMLVGRVMGPAQRIAQIFQQIQQVRVSALRIREIFQTKKESAIHSNTTRLPELKGEFILEQVSFKYHPESLPVLEKIDLHIPAGQIVGVVGLSGSGKSTFMKLLQRLFLTSEGRILIDGVNISEVNPEWFRQNIGVVLQDNLLLNRSIRENIALNNPSIEMEKIERVAKLSGAEDFILKLPQVYDTIVGEQGKLLSVGQRQRIALARALVKDPKILILDEATSALDYQSEQIIQENMKEICKNRTVFIVAHRFSTLRIAERILTLENGRIVEDGSIEELSTLKGRFSELLHLSDVATKLKFSKNKES